MTPHFLNKPNSMDQRGDECHKVSIAQVMEHNSSHTRAAHCRAGLLCRFLSRASTRSETRADAYRQTKVQKRVIGVSDLVGRVHRDEGGTISIASVFALLMLVFILGMVMNSTRQVDRKVKMQNAADAATQAGTLQLTRSMNTIAFTNHLLADVFALTAFFREARDQNAEKLSYDVLEHWRDVASFFENAEYPNFRRLGSAIRNKVPRDIDAVREYSQWAEYGASVMLPVFEAILQEELIPQFQRALVANSPRLAQVAAEEIASRHGANWPVPVQLHAVLWRTSGEQLVSESEPAQSFLPVVDPVMGNDPQQEKYRRDAFLERDRLAHRYLDEWNDESLRFFDMYWHMSHFHNSWRTFTCGQLNHLLEVEYPNTNLPMQLRDGDLFGRNERRPFTGDHHGQDDRPTDDWHDWERQEVLQRDYMVVGVVYAQPLTPKIPRYFSFASTTVTQAYAQSQYFVPRPRLVLPTVKLIDPPFSGFEPTTRHIGGLPGNFINEPEPSEPRVLMNAERFLASWSAESVYHRQSGEAFPSAWNLVSQNWESQLIPATCPRLPRILSQPVETSDGILIEPPDLSHLSENDMRWLNYH